MRSKAKGSSRKKFLTDAMEAHLIASVNANGAHVARSGARDGTGIQDKWALVAADLNQRAEFQDQGGNFTWAWCKLHYENIASAVLRHNNQASARTGGDDEVPDDFEDELNNMVGATEEQERLVSMLL